MEEREGGEEKIKRWKMKIKINMTVKMRERERKRKKEDRKSEGTSGKRVKM